MLIFDSVNVLDCHNDNAKAFAFALSYDSAVFLNTDSYINLTQFLYLNIYILRIFFVLILVFSLHSEYNI